MNLIRLIRMECDKLTHQRFAHAAMIAGLICLLLSALNAAGLLFEWSHPDMISENYYSLPAYKQNIFAQYSEPYSEAYFRRITYEMQRLREQEMQLSETEKQAPGKYGLTRGMDSILFSDLNSQCVRFQSLNVRRAQIAKDAESVIKTESDPFLLRYAKLAEQAYQSELHLETYYQDGLSKFTEDQVLFSRNSFSRYIVLLILCFLTAGVFSSEHENGSYCCVFTAKYGRGALYIAKLSACFLTVFTVLLAAWGITIAVYAVRWCGIHGLSSSVQTVQMMYRDLSLCPFPVSNFGFLLRAFGMQLLYDLLTVQTALLFSVLFRRTLPAMIGSAVCGIGSIELIYALGQADSGGAFVSWAQTWLPASLNFPEYYLSKMYVIQIGDTPVYRLHLLLTGSMLLLVILIIAAYALYTRAYSRRFYRRRVKQGGA